MLQEGNLTGTGAGWPHVPKDKLSGKKTGLAEQRALSGKKLEFMIFGRKATQEDYKDVMKLRREKIRRAKSQVEINLATSLKDNKKFFYKYIRNKRRAKENLHPLLNAGGNSDKGGGKS